MSYLPRWIYKDGKLSPKPGDGVLVKDINEYLLKVEEGFYPLRCDTKQGALEVPEIASIIGAKRIEIKQQAVIVDMITKDDDLLSMEEQFEERFDKPALVSRGRWKGQETKDFKKFKEAHNA